MCVCGVVVIVVVVCLFVGGVSLMLVFLWACFEGWGTPPGIENSRVLQLAACVVLVVVRVCVVGVVVVVVE